MRLIENALPLLKKHENHVLAQFDTPGEYVEYIKANAKEHSRASMGGAFYSHETFASACHKTINGDDKAAEESTKLLHKLSDLAIPQKRREIVEAKHGGRVSVAAYLGGSQSPVRKSVQTHSAKAPIAIVCGFVSSGMIDQADLRLRGIALAALVRRVAAQRPVELYLAGTGREQGADHSVSLLIKFPTRPIDTHRLAFMLSSQGFGRGLAFAGYQIADKMVQSLGGKSRQFVPGYGTQWGGGYDYSTSTNCEYAKDIAGYIKKPTFYFHDVVSTKDDMTEIKKDAVSWVNKKAKELIGD